jgi:hypothetical protein
MDLEDFTACESSQLRYFKQSELKGLFACIVVFYPIINHVDSPFHKPSELLSKDLEVLDRIGGSQ